MAANPLVRKIAALLGDASLERQMAAAIVAGELGLREPAVVDGLLALLDGGVPPLQRHALDALAKVGSKRSIPKVLPLLTAKDDEVREAAARAIAELGEAAIPLVRARLEEAEPLERRALEDVLARLGGTRGLGALLDAIDAEDVEAAKAATLAVRRRLKDASPRERRACLGQVERFLARGRTQRSPAMLSAALRILGYLEEAKAAPTLLRFATAKRHPVPIRREALEAIRFAPVRGDGRIAAKVLEVAELEPSTLGQAALLTLASIDPPPTLASRLGRLALRSDIGLARLAIDLLGRMRGAGAAAALGDVLLTTKDTARADQAATVLAGRGDACAPLAKAFLRARDRSRAEALGKLLRAHVSRLDARVVRTILREATTRLSTGRGPWEPLLQIAHDADPKAVATALRGMADGLRSRKPDRALAVLRLLARSPQASADDLYALASLSLRRGRRDLHPRTRAGDEALRTLTSLLARGYDVAGAMRKDRGLGLEHRYYVGFHFVEMEEPLGEDLLAHVVEAGGRRKVARAARRKLELSGIRE